MFCNSVLRAEVASYVRFLNCNSVNGVRVNFAGSNGLP